MVVRMKYFITVHQMTTSKNGASQDWTTILQDIDVNINSKHIEQYNANLCIMIMKFR